MRRFQAAQGNARRTETLVGPCRQKARANALTPPTVGDIFEMMQAHDRDRVALDAWYPVQAVEDLPRASRAQTTLLDTRLTVMRDAGGAYEVSGPAGRLPTSERYGYIWATLGAPVADLFDLPEYIEPDRRNMNAASMAVRVSAPRVVENFLDLGHFAMVHTGYLGVEPHTEIGPYSVAVREQELFATDCRVYQPLAALSAKGGQEVAYTYRVPHPYCAVLYKSCAIDAQRRDVIGIFVQPVTEDRCIAHMFLSMIDSENSDAALKSWQQLIFGQDKPILENQIPARLPLGHTAEFAVRADSMSVEYRRWLRERGVRYGTLL